MSSISAEISHNRPGALTAILLGLAGVAVTALWVFAMFVIIPYLFG